MVYGFKVGNTSGTLPGAVRGARGAACGTGAFDSKHNKRNPNIQSAIFIYDNNDSIRNTRHH